MGTVKILHCADLHMGTEFSGLEASKQKARKQDLLKAFVAIINLCFNEKVDLLLIAGDLFESWALEEETYTFVQQAFAKLVNTTIVIAAGNHDPLTADSLYLRHGFWSNNVMVLGAQFQSVLLDDLKVELWGASFSSAYVNKSLLKRTSPKEPNYTQIGLLHGTVGSENTLGHYNPISQTDIALSGLDYLALGHIHKRSKVVEKAGETFYAYPGNTEGRGFDERGQRGVLLGHIGKGVNQLRFVPTGQREYHKVIFFLGETRQAMEIADSLKKELEDTFGTAYEKNLYQVELTGELLERERLSLNSIQSYLGSFFYLSLKDKTTITVDYKALCTETSLKGVFAQEMLQLQEKEESDVLALALKLGLQAFYGEVNYL